MLQNILQFLIFHLILFFSEHNCDLCSSFLHLYWVHVSTSCTFIMNFHYCDSIYWKLIPLRLPHLPLFQMYIHFVHFNSNIYLPFSFRNWLNSIDTTIIRTNIRMKSIAVLGRFPSNGKLNACRQFYVFISVNL